MQLKGSCTFSPPAGLYSGPESAMSSVCVHSVTSTSLSVCPGCQSHTSSELLPCGGLSSSSVMRPSCSWQSTSESFGANHTRLPHSKTLPARAQLLSSVLSPAASHPFRSACVHKLFQLRPALRRVSVSKNHALTWLGRGGERRPRAAAAALQVVVLWCAAGAQGLHGMLGVLPHHNRARNLFRLAARPRGSHVDPAYAEVRHWRLQKDHAPPPCAQRHKRRVVSQGSTGRGGRRGASRAAAHLLCRCGWGRRKGSCLQQTRSCPAAAGGG